jgi:phosphonate transport system substrate-binding protein
MISLTNNTKAVRKVTLILILFLSLLSACNIRAEEVTSTETPTPTQGIKLTPTLTPTPRPTATPTLPPLGSAGNPLTMGFVVNPDDQAAIEAAEDLTFIIANDTDYVIDALFYPDFQSFASAALDGEIDLLWLDPLQYLYLNNLGAADVLLMTNHLGVYAYGVQFYANVFRDFTIHYDPQTNQSLGSMLQALQQFAGTRGCFLNPDSLPGYYVPLGLLANTSTPILEPIFTYDYSATIRALYIEGICDFGVTYALIGDPRSASDVLQDLPDAVNLIITVWQSEGIIPNINLSTSPSLPQFIEYQLEEAILNIQDTPENLSLLSTALDYQVEALKSVNDTFYNQLRGALNPLNLDLKALTHQ